MEGYDLSVNSFISRNLVPVTLGNIVGGVAFIVLQYVMYHPPVGQSQDIFGSESKVLGQEQSLFSSLFAIWTKCWPADFISLPLQQTEGGDDAAVEMKDKDRVHTF